MSGTKRAWNKLVDKTLFRYSATFNFHSAATEYLAMKLNKRELNSDNPSIYMFYWLSMQRRSTVMPKTLVV